MQIATIGLDIAKNVFQVHGIDINERVVVKKQLRRRRWLARLRQRRHPKRSLRRFQNLVYGPAWHRPMSGRR